MEEKSDVRLTLGISDHWSKEERQAGTISSSGAKLYVQMERPHAGNTWLRDAALARVAALLQEEILQACDYLCVERKGHLEGWGMAETPDLVEQQKQQDLNFLGIQTNWAEQALSRQVFTLKSAIAKLREECVPKGSRLRAFLIRECRRVSNGISESSSAHGSSSGRKLIGSGHRDPRLPVAEALGVQRPRWRA